MCCGDHANTVYGLLDGLENDCQARLRKLADVACGKAPTAILGRREESSFDPCQQVVILAGGCDDSLDARRQEYRAVLINALMHFEGTVVSGGTSSGISGLAGEVAQSLTDRGKRKFALVGYLPASLPERARRHTAYDRFVTTDSDAFSPLEPIQMWTDLMASGIAPEQVRLIGINGGDIAAFELRLALALGARVAVLLNSGRASQTILEDPVWRVSPRLLAVPSDAGSVWAFVDTGHAGEREISDDDLDKLAQAIHASYVANNAHRSPDSCLVPWEQLDEELRDSNRDQARKASRLLMTADYAIAPTSVERLAWGGFSAEDIELMAEMEHGRWNVERLSVGWKLGQRDPVAKTSPYLVAWRDLPEEIKETDRQAIRALPDVLALAGMSIRKTGCLLGMRMDILEYLGQRQDGHIYHAKNPHMNHEYYVKEITPDNPHEVEVLREGMRHLGELTDCPDIENYLAFSQDNRYYICTEWLQEDLASMIDQTRHVADDAFWLSVLEPMLGYVRALAFAHKKGVVHGNLSSRYLYLRKNRPSLLQREPQYSGVLAGFGPAARLSMHERLRALGIGAGSVGYLSPEQALYGLEGVSSRTDIWGIGACIYRLITGRTLHGIVESNKRENEEDAALDAVRDKLTTEHAVELGDLRRLAALQVQEIVSKCLQTDPGDRYSDAEALYEAIENTILHAGGLGNIERLLWPPYVSSWFSGPANEKRVSHDSSEQQDINASLVERYLARLLGYPPPKKWFDKSAKQYESLHEVLKSLIGGYSLAQLDRAAGNDGRPPSVGCIILLLGAAIGTKHRSIVERCDWDKNLLRDPFLSDRASSEDVRSAISDLFALFSTLSRHRTWPDESAVADLHIQERSLAVELRFPYKEWERALKYERRGNLFTAIHNFKRRFSETGLTEWVPDIAEVIGNSDHCCLRFSRVESNV